MPLIPNSNHYNNLVIGESLRGQKFRPLKTAVGKGLGRPWHKPTRIHALLMNTQWPPTLCVSLCDTDCTLFCDNYFPHKPWLGLEVVQLLKKKKTFRFFSVAIPPCLSPPKKIREVPPPCGQTKPGGFVAQWVLWTLNPTPRVLIVYVGWIMKGGDF